MIKGAIFDMDGTLVANSPVHIRAFEIFCDRYGVRGWKEKLGQAFGMGNDDIMRLIMPEEVIREKGLAALGDEKEAVYREIYAPEIEPMPGLVALLGKLRDAGIRCAVGSSGCRANVDFVLEKCDIESFFDAKINGDMVTRCKPRRASSRHGGPARAASSRWRPRTPAKCWPPKPTPTSSSATSATSPTSKHC